MVASSQGPAGSGGGVAFTPRSLLFLFGPASISLSVLVAAVGCLRNCLALVEHIKKHPVELDPWGCSVNSTCDVWKEERQKAPLGLLQDSRPVLWDREKTAQLQKSHTEGVFWLTWHFPYVPLLSAAQSSASIFYPCCLSDDIVEESSSPIYRIQCCCFRPLGNELGSGLCRMWKCIYLFPNASAPPLSHIIKYSSLNNTPCSFVHSKLMCSKSYRQFLLVKSVTDYINV